MTWLGVGSTNKTTVAAAAVSIVEIIDPDTLIDQIAGLSGTLIRLVGGITVAAAAINQDVFFRWGIITLNDDAADALVVPEVIADPSAWLHEQSGRVSCNNVVDSSQYYREMVDIRAKRRLLQGTRSVIATFENLTASGGSAHWFFWFKALVAH